MTTFSAAWLSLREPLDAASRAPQITQTLKRVCPDRPIAITDLASGTGANLRYLSPALGGHQEWRLIDHDPALLDAIPSRMREWAEGRGCSVTQSGRELIVSGRTFECRTRSAQQDLAVDLPAIDLPENALVTASALLDLVSADWLDALAQRCLRVRAPVLFALIYDGRVDFDPSEPEDERVRELVNIHQTTDKGFGPALGPAAAGKTRKRFAAMGYEVQSARSAWHVEPNEQALQAALLDGWLAAAVEIAPNETSTLKGWGQRRGAHVAAGRSVLSVGHVDLLGWIPD